MAKKTGLRNWPPKPSLLADKIRRDDARERLQYDIKAEQHWTPPVSKPVEPVVFVKPKEDDIHLTDEGWMG